MSVAIFSALLRRGSTTTQTKVLKVRGKGQDYTYFRSFLPNLKVVVKMLLQTLNEATTCLEFQDMRPIFQAIVSLLDTFRKITGFPKCFHQPLMFSLSCTEEGL